MFFFFSCVCTPAQALRWYDWFPIRSSMVLRRAANRTAVVSSVVDLAARVDSMETKVLEQLRLLAEQTSKDPKRVSAAEDDETQ